MKLYHVILSGYGRAPQYMDETQMTASFVVMAENMDKAIAAAKNKATELLNFGRFTGSGSCACDNGVFINNTNILR